MNIFDTHFHLFENRYQKETTQTLTEIMLGAQKAQVTKLCNVGIDLKTSQIAVSQTTQFSALYAAVGYHPTKAHLWNERSLSALTQLCRHPRTVAIGEIGLDFYHKFTTPTQQKTILNLQLQLAEKLNLPVLLHIRNAYEETLEIVRKYHVRGIVHCFSGTWKDAQVFLALGFLISFSGVVTFQNARELQIVAQNVPLEKLVVETDAPYLAPVPHRGKVNFPQYIHYTIQKLADLKQLSFAQVSEQTYQNAMQLFFPSLKTE